VTAAALMIAWVLSDPPSGDGWRIPPVPYLRAGLDFNRAYQSHLRERLDWVSYDRGELYAALAEAEALYVTWDAAWGARPDYTCSPEVKAMYLRKFRLALGREAYRQMELPPCVPVHRFNQLRP
jgi:hypothetical protein